MRIAATIGVALLVVAGPARSRASEGRGDVAGTFAVRSEAVRVDLVVRDRAGALLRDLRLEELELFEDGARQELTSLQLVEPAAGDPSVATPGLVAFAIDRLGPEARSLAHRTLLEYLHAPKEPRPVVGVFSIDGALVPLAHFTSDASTLRRAADALLEQNPRAFAGFREREEMRNLFAGMAEGVGQSHVAPAELPGVPECRGAEADQVRQTEFLAARMSTLFHSLERDEQGRSTVHALLALVAGLRDAPGRKAIVVFSEGLAVPVRVESELRAVVSAANQAGVAIYAADAGGLRVESGASETRRTIETIRTRLKNEVVLGPVAGPGSSLPTQGNMVLLERNEEALRLAPASGLEMLAAQTGGFLIQETNALAPRLAEVDEDLRSYYLLSYVPRDREFDGRFRSITVKVKRPHGRLQARRGYFALPEPLSVPVLEHEAPALALLESGALPSAVPLRLRGLQFPERPPVSTVPILAEVDAAALHADVEDERVFRQDFTILVLVRDRAGAIVAKLSQRYPLEGPVTALATPRRVLFYREAELPPGDYTLEAVAYDAASGRAGATSQALTVPESEAGRLRASSLMVVGRVEKLDGAAPALPTPLRYDEVLLYPNLGRPLRASAEALAFWITAWPSAGRPRVDARMEVLREGRTVAETPPTRLEPDAHGRIRMVSSLPTSALTPGRYELRMKLSDGRDAFTRSETVTIAP